jgi:hypothetical protein
MAFQARPRAHDVVQRYLSNDSARPVNRLEAKAEVAFQDYKVYFAASCNARQLKLWPASCRRRFVRGRCNWTLKVAREAKPIDRRKYRVFGQSKQNEAANDQTRVLELTAGAQAKCMTDRKQIGKGQQIRILADRSPALLTKVNIRIVRGQAAMTQGRCRLISERGSDLLAPRIRRNRLSHDPTNDQPPSPDANDHEPKQTDNPFGIDRRRELSEQRHNHDCVSVTIIVSFTQIAIITAFTNAAYSHQPL